MTSIRNFQSVTSSAIDAIRHEKGRTVVRFEDGTKYSYADKNKRMYKDLNDEAKGSKGKKFNKKYRPSRRPTKKR